MDHVSKIDNTLPKTNGMITYKVAASILNVSVNDAKEILQNYIDVKNNDAVNASYIIGGVTNDNDRKILIVSDKKYEEEKLSFKIITVDHIYSIQNYPLTDLSQIFNVDDYLKDEGKQTENSSKIVEEEPNSSDKSKLTNFATNEKSSEPNAETHMLLWTKDSSFLPLGKVEALNDKIMAKEKPKILNVNDEHMKEKPDEVKEDKIEKVVDGNKRKRMRLWTGKVSSFYQRQVKTKYNGEIVRMEPNIFDIHNDEDKKEKPDERKEVNSAPIPIETKVSEVESAGKKKPGQSSEKKKDHPVQDVDDNSDQAVLFAYIKLKRK